MKKLIIILSIIAQGITTLHAREQFLSNFMTNPRSINYQARLSAAVTADLNRTNYNIGNEHNGDDDIADHAGSFTKCLAHDITTGVVTAQGATNYEQLIKALTTGEQSDFNAIVRSSEATRKFANPQAAMTLSLVGCPGSILPMPSAPTLASDHAAAEMIEVYLKAICRDVHFAEYGTGANTDVDTVNGGSITANAAAILTALGDNYKGPTDDSVVTTSVLFRGTAEGCLDGPYVSQFLHLPLHPFFQSVAVQQYFPTAQDREFGVAWTDFVSIQNGAVPRPYNAQDFSGHQLIIRGRDAGTSVHSDGPGEYFFNAINILLFNGFPLAPNFPYNNGDMTNEDPFVTMMVSDVYYATLVAQQEALKHAWAHKWRANRRLRPEAMSGLIHQAKINDNNPYNLSSLLFGNLAEIDFLAWVRAYNERQSSVSNDPLSSAAAQTYVLSLMYPEGSPTHPSYPAGHAVIAGACATILKAFFDDQQLIKDHVQPVKPDPNDATALTNLPAGEGADILTVAGELNKLAANIAIARNVAGVHYRSDGDEGILLGEKVAMRILQDHARIYAEQDFAGFELTTFNGQRVRITSTQVINI